MRPIESRLAAVERQLRFHRAIIAALLVALVALVGFGATKKVPDYIEAQNFIVAGPDGPLGAFGVGPQGKPMFVVGKLSQPQLLFSPSKGGGYNLQLFGGGVTLSGPGGNASVAILPSAKYGGTILLSNPAGKPGVGLAGAENATGGGVSVFDKAGAEVVQLRTDKAGMGIVGAFDTQGRGRQLTPR